MLKHKQTQLEKILELQVFHLLTVIQIISKSETLKHLANHESDEDMAKIHGALDRFRFYKFEEMGLNKRGTPSF